MANVSTLQKPSTRRWPKRVLDAELLRRQMYPPVSIQIAPDDFREDWATVDELRAELAQTREDDPQRSWREWELALAERQVVRTPQCARFYRIVEKH
jgi:hypothetical protein